MVENSSLRIRKDSSSIFSRLIPDTSESAAKFLWYLAQSAKSMTDSRRKAWLQRFEDLYGQLDGQRSVSIQDLGWHRHLPDDTSTLHDSLYALQTYFALLCQLVTVSALQGEPCKFISSIAQLDNQTLKILLMEISSDLNSYSPNLVPATDSFGFDWYAATLDEEGLNAVRSVLHSLSEIIDDVIRLAGTDVMYCLYSELIPRNLLHVMGEFYTPLWLAELLVSDTQWDPSKTLIDPFCGSGVFLLAALSRAQKAGNLPLVSLGQLMGIDLNPVAVLSARTNLVLALRQSIMASSDPVKIPVMCADSLVTSLFKENLKEGAFNQTTDIWVDGRAIELPVCSLPDLSTHVQKVFAARGYDFSELFDNTPVKNFENRTISIESSLRTACHLLPLLLKPFDVIVTNPPWVGWEYMSRPYRERMKSAWLSYDLFIARGLEAAFIKEDLSTLALVTVWDRLLKTGGKSAVVIRAATMQSKLAARGLRRLSIHADSDPLKLEQIRTFDKTTVFKEAKTTAATWLVTKGRSTQFPVQVIQWSRRNSRQPQFWEPLINNTDWMIQTQLEASPAKSDDRFSPWTIGRSNLVASAQRLNGKSHYRARMGVFTGGANGVYYVSKVEPAQGLEGVSTYRNVPDRAKRVVANVTMLLEDELVHQVIRGRDLERWHAPPGTSLLCPHTVLTKMKAIPCEEMMRSYPNCLKYFESMRDVLDARKGFSGWENASREESYYCIQRLGEYSFEPYKVCWRYIASDFIVAVTRPDKHGRTPLVNDKVMMIGLSDPIEAYYVCGVLSSNPFRWSVVSTMTGTQISAGIIDHLNLPRFDSQNEIHIAISDECMRGHQSLASNLIDEANHCHKTLNAYVARLFQFSDNEMAAFSADVKARFGKEWL